MKKHHIVVIWLFAIALLSCSGRIDLHAFTKNKDMSPLTQA